MTQEKTKKVTNCIQGCVGLIRSEQKEHKCQKNFVRIFFKMYDSTPHMYVREKKEKAKEAVDKPGQWLRHSTEIQQWENMDRPLRYNEHLNMLRTASSLISIGKKGIHLQLKSMYEKTTLMLHLTALELTDLYKPIWPK